MFSYKPNAICMAGMTMPVGAGHAASHCWNRVRKPRQLINYARFWPQWWTFAKNRTAHAQTHYRKSTQWQWASFVSDYKKKKKKKKNLLELLLFYYASVISWPSTCLSNSMQLMHEILAIYSKTWYNGYIKGRICVGATADKDLVNSWSHFLLNHKIFILKMIREFIEV